MDWIGLLSSIIGHIVISLLGPAVNGFRRITAGPAEKILRPHRGDHLRLVFSSVPREAASAAEMEHPEFNYLAGPNEVDFALALYPVFKRLIPFGKHLLPVAFSVRMYESGAGVPTANEQMWRSNLIVSGSTKFNQVTRELHRLHVECTPRIVFPLEGGSITDQMRHVRYAAEREDGGLAYDYGLLAKYPNPYDPERTIVLVAGVESVFQIGITRTLSNRRAARQFLSKLKAQMRGQLPTYFEALIRAPAHGLEFTGDLDVLEAYAIEPS